MVLLERRHIHSDFGPMNIALFSMHLLYCADYGIKEASVVVKHIILYVIMAVNTYNHIMGKLAKEIKWINLVMVTYIESQK